MAELEVPERALVAGWRVFRGPKTDGHVTDAVINAAAPIIVAAELRRLAHMWDGNGKRPDPGPPKSVLEGCVRTWFQAADELRDRADELDPEGGR